MESSILRGCSVYIGNFFVVLSYRYKMQYCKLQDGRVMGTSDKRLVTCQVSGLAFKNGQIAYNDTILNQDTDMSGSCVAFNWSPKSSLPTATETGVKCNVKYINNPKSIKTTISGDVPFGYQIAKPKVGASLQELENTEMLYSVGFTNPDKAVYDEFIKKTQDLYDWESAPDKSVTGAPASTSASATPSTATTTSTATSESPSTTWATILIVIILVAIFGGLLLFIYFKVFGKKLPKLSTIGKSIKQKPA
jgi:hypothetical protein